MTNDPTETVTYQRYLLEQVHQIRDRWYAAPADLRAVLPRLDDPLWVERCSERAGSYSFREVHPDPLGSPDDIRVSGFLTDHERAELRALVLQNPAATQNFLLLVQEVYARLTFAVMVEPSWYRTDVSMQELVEEFGDLPWVGPKAPFRFIQLGFGESHVESEEEMDHPIDPRTPDDVRMELGLEGAYPGGCGILRAPRAWASHPREVWLQRLADLDRGWDLTFPTEHATNLYVPLRALFDPSCPLPAWEVCSVVPNLTFGSMSCAIRRRPGQPLAWMYPP